jgi:hypothetical protein
MRVTVDGAARPAPPGRAAGGAVDLRLGGEVVGNPTVCVDASAAPPGCNTAAALCGGGGCRLRVTTAGASKVVRERSRRVACCINADTANPGGDGDGLLGCGRDAGLAGAGESLGSAPRARSRLTCARRRRPARPPSPGGNATGAPTGSFSITLVNFGAPSALDAVFAAAKAKWESIITIDVRTGGDAGWRVSGGGGAGPPAGGPPARAGGSVSRTRPPGALSKTPPFLPAAPALASLPAAPGHPGRRHRPLRRLHAAPLPARSRRRRWVAPGKAQRGGRGCDFERRKPHSFLRGWRRWGGLAPRGVPTPPAPHLPTPPRAPQPRSAVIFYRVAPIDSKVRPAAAHRPVWLGPGRRSRWPPCTCVRRASPARPAPHQALAAPHLPLLPSIPRAASSAARGPSSRGLTAPRCPRRASWCVAARLRARPARRRSPRCRSSHRGSSVPPPPAPPPPRLLASPPRWSHPSAQTTRAARVQGRSNLGQ